VGDRSTWPVVVSTACARMCMEGFGFDDVHATREWILELMVAKGVLTEKLPKQFGGRRSPSGSFVLVADLFALGLAVDRDGRQQWIATSCALDPRHQRVLDPTGLSGRALLAVVGISAHVVERFQQRAGGDTDAAVANRQLLELLEPTVSARPRPPSWARTVAADAFLVAGEYDEHVIPCRRAGGVRAFTATTLAAPVAWQPGDSTPLIVLGVIDGRSWLARVVDTLRGRETVR